MSDQSAVLEDGEGLFRKGAKVILVTFVESAYNSTDRGSVRHALVLMVDKCFVRHYYMFANREQEAASNK